MKHTMISHLLANAKEQNKGNDGTADITLFINGRNETVALDVYGKEQQKTIGLCDPYGTRATSLRNNKWYIIFYVFLSELILVEIIPWITVVILNISTWKGITRFQKKRQALKTKKCSVVVKGTNL